MNLSINFVFSDLTLVFLGKISYYTLPPKRDNVEESDAVIISDARKEFNIDEIYKSESSYIGDLKSIEDFHHIEILPNAPLSIDEEMIEVIVPVLP
jgi:nuclear GTP-binding protein